MTERTRIYKAGLDGYEVIPILLAPDKIVESGYMIAHFIAPQQEVFLQSSRSFLHLHLKDEDIPADIDVLNSVNCGLLLYSTGHSGPKNCSN